MGRGSKLSGLESRSGLSCGRETAGRRRWEGWKEERLRKEGREEGRERTLGKLSDLVGGDLSESLPRNKTTR